MIDFLQTVRMTSAKKLLFFTVAITIGTALPATAQQNSTQDLKAAAAALIAQRVQFYNKKDAAGIAAQFTSDAIFVELLPQLQVRQELVVLLAGGRQHASVAVEPQDFALRAKQAVGGGHFHVRDRKQGRRRREPWRRLCGEGAE